MIYGTNNPRFIKCAKEFPGKLEKVHEGRISLQPGAVYLGASKKIAVVCNVCGHEWSPFATNLTQGKGCPGCHQKRKENSAGRRSPRASEETKEFARELRKTGMVYKAIAEQLGVAPQTVARWCDSRQAAIALEHTQKWNAAAKASGKQAELCAAYYQTEHGRAIHLANAEKRRAL